MRTAVPISMEVSRGSQNSDDRHGGGIMTCIRESLAYSSSVISEDPECLITSIITGSATMKIVNFYVPPGKVYPSDQLELILNHSSECLICGDLNARSPMFGPCLSDSRGKIVDFLAPKKINLVPLNTEIGTHLAPNGSSSAFDVYWFPQTKPSSRPGRYWTRTLEAIISSSRSS